MGRPCPYHMLLRVWLGIWSIEHVEGEVMIKWVSPATNIG